MPFNETGESQGFSDPRLIFRKEREGELKRLHTIFRPMNPDGASSHPHDLQESQSHSEKYESKRTLVKDTKVSEIIPQLSLEHIDSKRQDLINEIDRCETIYSKEKGNLKNILGREQLAIIMKPFFNTKNNLEEIKKNVDKRLEDLHKQQRDKEAALLELTQQIETSTPAILDFDDRSKHMGLHGAARQLQRELEGIPQQRSQILEHYEQAIQMCKKNFEDFVKDFKTNLEINEQYSLLHSRIVIMEGKYGELVFMLQPKKKTPKIEQAIKYYNSCCDEYKSAMKTIEDKQKEYNNSLETCIDNLQAQQGEIFKQMFSSPPDDGKLMLKNQVEEKMRELAEFANNKLIFFEQQKEELSRIEANIKEHEKGVNKNYNLVTNKLNEGQ